VTFTVVVAPAANGTGAPNGATLNSPAFAPLIATALMITSAAPVFCKVTGKTTGALPTATPP
jgi:hypothetical protein